MLITIIPAYNEEKTVANVVADVKRYVDRVIVIDDGSRDATNERARAAGATVYRHAINRGLGAALGTGMVAALNAGADFVVTVDADGQHRGEDIPRLVAALGNADAAIGARVQQRSEMPAHRSLANWIANASTWFLFGVWTNDSQSGLRLFRASALRKIRLWDIHFENMEVSSAIVAELHRHNLRFVEVSIAPVYTAYSLSKGQGLRLGLKTLVRLLWYKLRM